VWDASDDEAKVYALAGFIFPPDTSKQEGLDPNGELIVADGVSGGLHDPRAQGPSRDVLAAARQQLSRLFGPDAGRPTRVAVKSWFLDKWTAAPRAGVEQRGAYCVIVCLFSCGAKSHLCV
jgi:hypothetical protein